jgi:hypothetical protein
MNLGNSDLSNYVETVNFCLTNYNCVSITETSRLGLLRETIAVYCTNLAKTFIYTLWGKSGVCNVIADGAYSYHYALKG